MMALRFARSTTSKRSVACLGRMLQAQQQRQSLWTVPEANHNFQLEPQDVQLQPEMASKVFQNMALEDDEQKNDYAYSMTHAQEQDSLDAWRFVVLSDPRMQEQLKRSCGQLKPKKVEETTHLDDAPLPKTLQDALRPTRRAIVITEAKKPYRVFDVNRSWEDLCGYSYIESKGKTLGSLLRGPDTDPLASTSLISRLLQGEEAGTTLVNYKKSGKPFHNRVRVGPLKDEESNKVTHFVGVLQEVKE